MNRMICLTVAAGLLVSSSAFGAVSEDEIQELREQLSALSQRLFKVDYGITRNWVIGAQYFINETDVSSGAKSDYNRLMLDAQWKWK